MKSEYEHYKWWEDKNRKIYINNKSEMAKYCEVSLKTIDDWIRKGAPVLRHGSNGVDYELDVTAFLEWYFAHQAGVSIAEYRQWREAHDRDLWERYAPLEELREENAALRRQLAALRREVRARER